MQFSFNRVMLLIRKQFAENIQLYFFSLLIIAGVIFLFSLGDVRGENGFTLRDQAVFLTSGLVLSGSVFTTTIFNQFSNKIKGVQSLMLPASVLEKLVTAIIFSIILFPLAYTIFVYPVLYVVHIIDLNQGHLNELNGFHNIHMMQYLFVEFLVLQPVVLLCSLMFKRYTTIKTVVFIGTVFFGMMFVSPFITQNIIKSSRPKYLKIKDITYDSQERIIETSYHTEVNYTSYLYSTPFSGIAFSKPDYDGILSVKLPEKQDLLFDLLMCLSIFFLYAVTWFKLKEIEL